MEANWRCRALHDVRWKDLGDRGFPDRIAWLKAAAEADPSLNLCLVLGSTAARQAARMRFGPYWSTATSTRSARPTAAVMTAHGQDLVERALNGLAGRPAL